MELNAPREIDLYSAVIWLGNRGQSDREIAARLKVSKNVAAYYRKRASQNQPVAPYKALDVQIQQSLLREGFDTWLSIPRGRRGGFHLPEKKKEEILRLIRLGMSQREIARTAKVAINTVKRHINIFKEEGPRCEHGVSVYACRTCAAMRRVIADDGSLRFETGPRK